MEASRTSSDCARKELSLDERKFIQESKSRNKELTLKEREVAAKETELHRSQWLNPTVIGLFAAAIGLIGNLIVAYIGNRNTQEVEHSRAQSSLIIQAVGTGDAKTACKNLISFLRLGLLDDPKGTISQCENALGPIPVLPAARTYTPIANVTAVDLAILKAKPRLIEHLLEETPNGRCARLTYYRNVAKLVMDMFKNVDEVTRPSNRLGLVDDQHMRESMIADAIRHTDLALPGMLEGFVRLRLFSSYMHAL